MLVKRAHGHAALLIPYGMVGTENHNNINTIMAQS